MMKIAIFGATSAIAEAVARRYAAQGAHLALVGRNAERLAQIAEDLRIRGAIRVDTFTSDLAKWSEFSSLIARIIKELGSIDLALLAQGRLGSQAELERNSSSLVELMEVNLVAPMVLSHELAQQMETQRSGTIAVIGSVAGDRGRQSNYVYGASKGGLEVFLSGLRNRLVFSGVHVLTIKPGFVDTPMTASFPKSPLWAKPDAVAVSIVRAVHRKTNVLYTPWFWCGIMSIIRWIPERIFKKMKL